MLCAFPSIEELLDVIKNTSMDSAAGLDGFNGYFCIACWDIIKNDLFDAVKVFFAGEHWLSLGPVQFCS